MVAMVREMFKKKRFKKVDHRGQLCGVYFCNYLVCGNEFYRVIYICFTGSPPLTGSGTVHVFVQDVNDHSPQFERTDYVAFIEENLPAGSDVIHIEAMDYDAGLNSKLR